MPTYEYACKSCGEHLEVVQSFRDASLTECAACGGPLRKVFGNIGIVLKGSGFYKTDSRPAGGSGKTATSEKSSESKSSESKSSESKSSESKSSESSAKADSASSDGKSKSTTEAKTA